MVTADAEKTLHLFSRFIEKNMGLHFRPERFFELEQKVAAVSREFGYHDPEACMLWLMSAPLSREQLEVLARTLTIGETYFLRDPESYRVLQERLLPDLIASRRDTGKKLRIWSAGCSSGEEPYTIAILLSRLIPDLESWDITLLGTDINPRALEKGRQGVYSQWSFRNAPRWFLDYFRKRPDGRMEILPKIRGMVRFAPLNLAAEGYPSPLNHTSGVDIIFCRNVMLYFEPELIQRVLGRFHDALNEGGWLLVSPTELDHRQFTNFRCRRYPGAFIFEKVSRRPAPSRPRAHLELLPSPDAAEAAPLPPPSQDAPLPAEPVPPKLSPPPPPDPEPAAEPEGMPPELQAKALADQGRFDEARSTLEEAMRRDRLNAKNYYLLSSILSEQGELEEAQGALKRALYLDPDYLLAYVALGNLQRQAGREKESQKSFANALALLEKQDPGEVLPEADGITAGGLAQIIRGNKGER